MSGNVTQKIQVLISDEDMGILNALIMLNAIRTATKPVPLYTFVRELIRDYIDTNKGILDNKQEQRSIAADDVRRYINALKTEKENNSNKS